MNKLSEVIHFYLGADILMEKSNYWFVHELSWHNGERKVLTPYYLSALHNNGMNLVYRPLLRTLESMTEEEAIEVCRLRWDSTFMQVHRDMGGGISTNFKFTYQPYDATMYEDAQECCYLDFNCRTNQKDEKFRMTIYPDFSVYIGWLRPDGNHNVTPLARTTETVLYFLSKYFDLFDLIKDGFAINKNQTT